MNKSVLVSESAVVLPERDTMSFIHLGSDFSIVKANNYGGNAVSIGGFNGWNTVVSGQGSYVKVVQG